MGTVCRTIPIKHQWFHHLLLPRVLVLSLRQLLKIGNKMSWKTMDDG